MQVQHKKEGGKGMFFIVNNENIVAEMTYTMPSGNKMIIDHTEVDDSLQGKGIGLRLLEALVDYARASDIKVIPLCPFAKSVFDKKAEWRDVLS